MIYHPNPNLYRAGRWAYNEASPLVISGNDGLSITMQSSEGVRQGDPFGPLLFSIGARNTLDALQQHLGPGHAVLAYLDDVYILSEEAGALVTASAFLRENDAGLCLNMSKCTESSLVSVSQGGLEVLGTCVGSAAARTAFLHRKIDEQIPALGRLADLPAQEALLLLRQCLQANLRHLQRSLKTDDITDPWTVLDNALLDRFLAIRGSPRRLESDASLVSLPVRLGGMGLLSYSEVAPHARSAMAETADSLLKTALDHIYTDIEVADDPAESISQSQSQRIRCQKAFVVRREFLLASLPVASRAAVMDNASPLARRWLSAIPFGPHLRLSSTEVAAGLSIRTLCPGQDDHCQHCGQANTFGHDDVCTARPLWRIARHEQVKSLLKKHISTIADTSVKLEPFVPGSHLRTDLRVTGTGSFHGPVSEYDVTIVSAATLAGRSPFSLPSSSFPFSTSSFPLSSSSSDPSLPSTTLASSSLLRQLTFTENEKRTKYEGRTASPFFPIVISSGGTLSPSTVAIFDHWRGLMPSYSLFSRLLSLSLLRARARFFAF